MVPGPGARAYTAKRLAAAVVDASIAYVLTLVPGFGGVLAFFYVLSRDGLMFGLTRHDAFRNRSIGKRVVGLAVIPDSADVVTIGISLRRNVSLVIGGLFGVAISPVLNIGDGGFLVALLGGPISTVVVATGALPLMAEGVLVLRSQEHLRWGDRFARTRVVEG